MIEKAVVHLGVHKTGTTALQRHLNEYSKKFHEERIAVRGPQRPFTHAFRKKTAISAPDLSEERMLLLEGLGDATRGLALSNEMILGPIRPEKWDRLYPEAAECVKGIKRCLDGADILFVVTIRDYADFLDSCYVQRIKNQANISASEFRASLRLENFSWAEMISRMRMAAAPFRVSVHAYDRTVNSRIIADIADHLGVAAIPSIGDRVENVRYSDTGLRIAQLANPELSPEGRTALRQFLDQHMRRSKSDSFSIFSEAEKLALKEQFIRDVAAIEGEPLQPSVEA